MAVHLKMSVHQSQKKQSIMSRVCNCLSNKKNDPRNNEEQPSVQERPRPQRSASQSNLRPRSTIAQRPPGTIRQQNPQPPPQPVANTSLVPCINHVSSLSLNIISNVAPDLVKVRYYKAVRRPPAKGRRQESIQVSLSHMFSLFRQ